ncbi:iron reductase, partial [Methylobacterium hispanicum]
ALCPGTAGCRRRTCCLRSRLPGIPSCGALCPLEPRADA